ncbi:MAG: peroxisomal assembly protein, partial [Watsoniomyces obsoletus]
AYAALDHNRHGGRVPKTIEIKAILASPIDLDTVYVTVEKGLLDKVDEIQNKFGGGFQQQAKSWKMDRKNSVNDLLPKPEDRLRALVREALSKLNLIHAGDVFHLPLPPHPITHVPPHQLLPLSVSLFCKVA